MSDPSAPETSFAVAGQLPDRFRLGGVQVCPASREIEGPAGSATLEPRVLQVLLALHGGSGQVVGREALMGLCWPGAVVGDDALNRAVSELRKALRAVGGALSIDTISKSGYRLRTLAGPSDAVQSPADVPASHVAVRPSDAGSAPAAVDASSNTAEVGQAGVTRRRAAFIAAATCIAAFGAAAVWRSSPGAAKARATALVDRAAALMRDDRWGPVDPIQLLREAVRVNPDEARAWGILSLALRDVTAGPDAAAEFRAIADCHLAAQQALTRDPAQPDALVTLATLEPFYTAWEAAEWQLAAILKRFPDHEPALEAMAQLCASTGRTHEGSLIRARLIAIEPLSPHYAAEAVLAFWNAGDDAGMNRQAEAAARTWPENAEVWQARIHTLGFSGRSAEALALIERRGIPDGYPPLVAQAYVAAYRVHAKQGSGDVAIAAAVAAAHGRQSSAPHTIPVLAWLGATDLAFAAANAYFFGRGPFKVPYQFGASQPAVRETRYRNTYPLFVPPARTLWTDARFAALCGDIGLRAYWRAAGVRPDLLGTRPFDV